MKPHISWKDSIWFSDVDDTLITTAESTPEAAEGIQDVFTERFGEKIAQEVKQAFLAVFNTMLTGHQGQESSEHQAIIEAINNYQQEVIQKFGRAKLWSREVFLAIACKRLNLTPSPELISEAIDAYWVRLTQVAKVLPGVLELVKEIHAHQRPLYLVTGSDARMTLQENGQFVYDPQISESFKQERIALLRQKGIEFNLVSIGDPEDKPHRDFFDKAIHMAEKDLGKSIDLSQSIMIGDSYTADLATPKEQMGFGLVVWYKKGQEATEIIDEHQVNTGNLADISSLFS